MSMALELAEKAQIRFFTLLEQGESRTAVIFTALQALVSTTGLAEGNHGNIVKGSAVLGTRHAAECEKIAEQISANAQKGDTVEDLYDIASTFAKTLGCSLLTAAECRIRATAVR